MEICTTSSSLVGLDVGYGNLKACGMVLGTESVDVVKLPVGAAPLDQAPTLLNNEPDLRGGEAVTIQGLPWVGGTDPMILQGFTRQADRSYITSPEYLALYYAALARLGYDHVGILVTGLPCDQYDGPDSKMIRQRLGERLKGEHRISPTRTVRVDRVFVMAQPMGTYASVFHDQATLDDGRTVLVIDVGFYSVDWVLMQGGSVRGGTAQTNPAATGRILELAARQISENHDGAQVSVNRLEAAFRSGQEQLRLGVHTVAYRQYIDQAAAVVSRQVMSAVLASVRDLGDVIDSVILTGGGAGLFEPAARLSFRASDVRMTADPVMANAQGYLWLARRAHQAAIRQAAVGKQKRA
ncbi:hypothetical protein RHOFW510R12_01010 [Rhodanobacter sp. FW510-R12]|uniref:ParM/StbA family protein n=1 Tax=Rhodanobacter thiooxydans TaxID=416169 RepID=UPI000918389C|nr:ParM/StbA family protein [Rhodanobacter thiooxydans]UJJ56681.1 ParM/StbA family protein [Rhodanobacter thiooxydans]